MASRTGRGQAEIDLGVVDAPEHTIKLVDVRAKTYRNEAAVSASIRAAREGAPANPRYAAAETLAREVARAMDVAAKKNDPYAIAQLTPRLLDVLRELRLTPAAEQSTSSLDDLLADLAEAD